MTLLLILALLSGQPASPVVDAVPSPDLPSQRAAVPLIPPSLEFWIEAEAHRQALSPVQPLDLRARARVELGPRGGGPEADALITATVAEVYTRAVARPESTPATRATLQGYMGQNAPQPAQG